MEREFDMANNGLTKEEIANINRLAKCSLPGCSGLVIGYVGDKRKSPVEPKPESSPEPTQEPWQPVKGGDNG